MDRSRRAIHAGFRRRLRDRFPPARAGVPAVAWLVLLIGNFIAGCDSSDPEYFGTTVPQHGPEVLWLNNGGEAQWIDPGRCSDSNGGDVILNTFAGLVESHPKTLEPMPDVARDWDISADGKVYTFHLRETRWSDGVPVTAHDFEWSHKRLLAPALASKYAYIAYPLKNAEAYNMQALFLTGVDLATSLEDVRDLVAEVIPVERVDISHDPPGFCVFIGGDDDQRDALRKRAILQLNGRRLAGQSLTVRVADSTLVGVEALDASTLRFTLENSIPYFLHLLSFYSFMPVPRHVLDRLEDQGINPDLWTRPQHIVSNGAYTLKEWKFRQFMRFEKNPHYWNAANVRTPEVKAYLVESYNTSLNMYRAGEIDFPGGNLALPSEFMDHLQQFHDYRYDPYVAVYFFWFNTTRPPLDKLEVRQALSLAIDRTAIVKYIKRGGETPTADVVPQGLAGYPGLNSPLFDPERARQLLEAAGYPGGQGMPPITLIYNTSEGHKQIAEAAQQMWKDNLGIHVNIENQEWKVYLKSMETMDFQIARLGWIGDYPDPYTFLDLLLPKSGNNHSNWSDERFSELLREANQTIDQETRIARLLEAERYAMTQQPLMPLYVYTKTTLIKPYVRGVWGNYMDRHLWKYVWIDERWYDGVPSEPVVDSPPPLTPRY